MGAGDPARKKKIFKRGKKKRSSIVTWLPLSKRNIEEFSLKPKKEPQRKTQLTASRLQTLFKTRKNVFTVLGKELGKKGRDFSRLGRGD